MTQILVGIMAVLSLTSFPAALANPAYKGICKADGQVVIYQSGSEHNLAYCELQSGMVQPEPRALSRAEVSQIFAESQSEFAKPDEQQKFWADKMQTPFSSMQKSNDQAVIGHQMMMFPGGADADATLRAAGWLKKVKGGKADVLKLDLKASERMTMGWYQSFMKACRLGGGTWTLPVSSGPFTDIPEEAQGKILCTCHGKEFSNPIDYRCDPKNSKSPFVENETGAPSAAPASKTKVIGR